jgi:hypothetical protein
MSSKQFVIDNYYELVALQRVFHEAKFCLVPNDEEISGSPIVANMFRKLMNVLVAVDVDRAGEHMAQRWLDWLTINNSRDEWQAALAKAKKEGAWAAWSYEEKSEYIRNLLSPFIISNELIENFMDDVKQFTRGEDEFVN